MRRRATRRLRRTTGALTVGLTILGMAVPTTAAHAAGPAPRTQAPAAAGTKSGTVTDNDKPARALAASGAAVTVTLVTGDKVDVGLGADGRPVVRGTEAAPRPGGAPVVFHTITHAGKVHVVPNDALTLLGAGMLDWSLFDLAELTELVAAGRTGAVPVIVTYTDNNAVTRAPKVAGATVGRELPSIDGRSVTIADDGTWWRGVRGKTASASGTARSAGSLAGVEKVWLNGLAEVSLDVSVPQIGGDVAWSRGYDGKGVTVAVLDSGIDATHPDVAASLVEQRDFTGSADGAKDGHGHGTHVASTILGSGAASKGLRKGVAPGARLVAGKVCGDDGTCANDAIIAGMEWAAHSGAKVVNMSLGGEPSDGTDPLSESLDSLSRDTGTLFVVAAGNEGPDARTVGAPGSADEALTVAAVDKKDKMAYFSSRGPRVGDYAPKPDIAAPGVDIVAARAAGTSMGTVVDDSYTTASGTSMATPHVAGAAAVVAQQHPDLTGGQIKALLTSTAKDLGFEASAQGVGRVTLAEATQPQVIAAGNLSFGRSAYPHSPVTRKVTYTNLTDKATTLHLTGSLTSGDTRAPAGLLTLDRDEVSLPAGGSAEVSVTMDGRVLGTDGTFGRWDGLLTARDTSGEVRTTSRMHTFLEAQRFPLTVNVVPPKDATDVSYGSASFLPVDDKVLLHDGLVTASGGQSITASLFSGGTYSASVPVTWRDTAGQVQSAVPVLPEVTVDKATTVTLDLRRLTPIRVEAPRTTETYYALSSTERVSATGVWKMTSDLTTTYRAQEPNWWALPTGKARTGTLTHNVYSVRTTPVVTLKAVGGGDSFSLPARYQTPDVSMLGTHYWQTGETQGIRDASTPIPRLPAKGRVPVVYAGTGSAAELADVDPRGKLVLVTPTDICGTTCDFPRLRDERVAVAAKAGAVGVLVAVPGLTSLGADYAPTLCADGPESCTPLAPYAALPVVSVGHAEADRLIKRIGTHRAVEMVLGGSAEPEVYTARFAAKGQIPSNLRYRIDVNDLDRVDHYFHADRPGTITKLVWEQRTQSTPTAVSVNLPRVATQHTLTTFVVRQDNAVDRFFTSWGDTGEDSALVRARGETHDLVLARRNALHWNAGPSVPGAVPQVRTKSGFTVGSGPCAGCRQGDTFYPTFYLTGSGGGRQALIGILDNDYLSETVFGITSCGPTAPPAYPTLDSACDFTLSDESGHELERRTQRLNASAIGSRR
ncbi:S8 family peptidase [Streptomyces viridiviolaceus]